MSCVLYNIVKEGFVANLTTAPVDLLTDAQILALYDNDPTTPAVTISGAATLGLLAEYGESYEVCYVDYHTDESMVSNISIAYGTTSGTENVAPIALHIAGVYRATVSGVINFIELRHVLTAVSTDINQLEIIAVKNETLGFGTSITDQTENLRLEHATIGTLSATANVIPLFNDNHSEQVIKIAIAPTLTAADDYLHLATDVDGPYFGIDDFGVQQPGPDPITLVNDPMDSATDIHPQWQRRQGYNANSIFPTPEGIVIDAGFYAHADNSSSYNVTSVGLLTKEFFTPSSFTAEIQVRFLDSHGPFSAENRPFYFAITNGHYLPDIGFHEAFRTDGRRGHTTVGVGLAAEREAGTFGTKDAFNVRFSHTDGRDSDNPYAGNTDSAERNWFVRGGYAYQSTTVGPNLATREDILNQGQAMNDFTESGEWHTWRITYDHTKQEIRGYYDKLFAGSAILKSDVFHEGTKFFIGGMLESGWKFAVRNFKIYPNKIYRQKVVSLPANGGTFSATVSGEAFNINRITDQNNSTMYVGPNPDEFTTIRVDFDKSYDIVNYYIFQRHTGQYTETIPTIFGQRHNVKTADTAVVDYGGVATYTDFYTPAINDYFDHARQPDRRAPHWISSQGKTPTISGVDYVEWNFVDYSTGWEQGGGQDFALHIREMYVYAEEWVDAVVIPEDPSPTKFRWSEGRWRNLKQIGTAGSLTLSDPNHVEVAYWPTPEYLTEGVDYGSSTALYRSQTSNGTFLNPLTETLFSSPNNTHTNSQVAWYSRSQTAPEPFFIWRQFAEEVDLTVITSRCDTFVNQVVPKEFKYQYLKDGGDPNTEEAWADIPPMTKEYVQQSVDVPDAALRFNEYKKYKIANNDGEYYTDNHLQPIATAGDPGGVGQFQLGIGGNSSYKVLTDKVPAGYRLLDNVFNSSNNNRSIRATLIVELDTPIRTRGVRLVVKNPVVSANTGAEENTFSLFEFQAWGETGNGSYTSPVFDTGTPQNTERLVVDTNEFPTTRAEVYVRSSPLPPVQRYDIQFEVWEPLGALGQPDFGVSTSDTRGRVISIGDESHFIIDDHYVYNHRTDTWSQPYGSYPAQVPGGPVAGDTFDTADLGSGSTAAMRPDPSVDDRAALVDGVIYVACEETNLTASNRLMYLDLNATDPSWFALSGQRPIETTDATMCAYQGKLFFFNENGPVYYWDTEVANWFFVEDSLPTLGGNRDRVTSVLAGDKIYLFGSNNTNDDATSHEVSIFDPNTETFTSGTPSPWSMRSVQPILAEDGTIYVLTRNSLDRHHRYHPEEDRWEIVSSLSWIRDYHNGNSSAYFFFHYDGYIYKVYAGFQGLARTLVRKRPWESGKSPDIRDSVWGNTSAANTILWKKIDGLGELMPQERYFQFKVEMHAEPKLRLLNNRTVTDWVESPVLNSVKIVSPQSVVVAASGTANAYLKVSATEEGDYKLWYSGRTRVRTGVTTSDGNSYLNIFVNDWSIMYSPSKGPANWGNPTTASGFYTYHDPGNNFSVWNDGFAARSPWVEPDGTGGYDVWYAVADITTQTDRYNIPEDGQPGGSSIYYVNTSDPSNISADNLAQVAIPTKILSQSELIWHPTVVVHSPDNLKMWFTMQDADPATALPYQRIGYAESTDKVTWTNHQTVIDTDEDTIFGHDAQAAYRPCVLHESGMYRMWYTGRDAAGIDRILYRESTDGITWGAIQLNVDLAAHGYDDSQGASRPHVVKDAANYYLFYFGYDGNAHVVIRAESPDGLDWDKFVVVAPGFGIEGQSDSEGVDDFFVLIEKSDVIPGDVLTSGKLKIHNEGTGI